MSTFRVLYFSAVDIGSIDNGGSLCCRSHLRSLVADPAIELSVIIAGPQLLEEGVRQFTTSLGAALQFIPFGRNHRAINPFHRFRHFQRKYPFAHEKSSHRQRHVDRKFADALMVEKPDIVIVEYLPSVFYIPSLFASSIPRCVITLNREAEFHREQLRARGANPNSPMLRMAFRRWAGIEQSILGNFHGVVTLTENDLPKSGSKPPIAISIPAFLDPSERRWTYNANRRVGFVGNIAHFPNRFAIEWICTRLAPAISILDPGIRFRIIGAKTEDVPSSWRHSSVEFLGLSNRQQVEEEFAKNDLFIAPIANDYGSKMKLLECIAFGTPFFATQNALSGLPFLREIPVIDLENPEACARTLCQLVDAGLPELSGKIQAQVEAFQNRQHGIWGRTIANIIHVATEEPETTQALRRIPV